MVKPDPFGFDIRVKSDKQKRSRGKRGMSGAFETSQRVCEHPACEEAGKYRAPKSPDTHFAQIPSCLAEDVLKAYDSQSR